MFSNLSFNAISNITEVTSNYFRSSQEKEEEELQKAQEDLQRKEEKLQKIQENLQQIQENLQKEELKNQKIQELGDILCILLQFIKLTNKYNPDDDTILKEINTILKEINNINIIKFKFNNDVINNNNTDLYIKSLLTQYLQTYIRNLKIPTIYVIGNNNDSYQTLYSNYDNSNKEFGVHIWNPDYIKKLYEKFKIPTFSEFIINLIIETQNFLKISDDKIFFNENFVIIVKFFDDDDHKLSDLLKYFLKTLTWITKDQGIKNLKKYDEISKNFKSDNQYVLKLQKIFDTYSKFIRDNIIQQK